MTESSKRHQHLLSRENNNPVVRYSLLQLLGKEQLYELEDLRELSLSELADLSLICGERVSSVPEECEFVCRLLSLEEKPGGVVKFVEFSKESFDTTVHYETKIRSLLVTRMKAIIFQNMDIQVYVMEESKAEGYMVHFQDKRKVKVSLGLETFQRMVASKDKVEQEFGRFKVRRNAKKKKMSKTLGAAASVGKDENKGAGRQARVPSHRSSFKL